MNYLTQSELDSMVLDQDYHFTSNSGTERIQETYNTLSRILAYYPAEVLHRYSLQDGKKYLEWSSIKLKHDLHLEMSWNSRDKRWSIYCRSLHDLKHIDQHRSKMKLDLKEPNSIGVLTTKKIEQWVTYWEKVYAALYAEDLANRLAKEAALEQIRSLGMPIQEWDNKSKGVVSRNGITLNYCIETTYVSIRIQLGSVDHTVEAFKQLSENKYVKKN